MRDLGAGSIILAMTRPTASSRVTLVEDRRGAGASPGSAPVRRYRLARVRFDGPPADGDKRFEYLKRSHD